MANSKITTARQEYAEVDTAPDANGFYTNPVTLHTKPDKRVSFSIRGTGVIVVVLQYKCALDNTWMTYVNANVTVDKGCRFQMEDFSQGIEWRAGVVAAADYTSGSLKFGFDW